MLCGLLVKHHKPVYDGDCVTLDELVGEISDTLWGIKLQQARIFARLFEAHLLLLRYVQAVW